MENKKSSYIIPIISIVSFFMLLIGAAYSYVNVPQPDTDNISLNANYSLPGKCTFTVTPITTSGYTSNCNITASTASTVNFTDSIITSEELIEDYVNNQIAKAKCGLNITVSGGTNCRCPYTVSIEKTGNYDRHFAGLGEYTAKISKNNTVILPEDNITDYNKTIDGGIIDSGNSTSASIKYTMDIAIYNVPYSQDILRSKNLSYKLKVTPGECNPSIVCKTTGSATYRSGQQFTCNLNGTNYNFYYLEEDQNDSSKIDLIMANNLISNNPETYIPETFEASTFSFADYVDDATGCGISYPDNLHSALLNAQKILGNNVIVSGLTDEQRNRLDSDPEFDYGDWMDGNYWLIRDDYINGWISWSSGDSYPILEGCNYYPVEAGFRPVIIIDKSLVKKV